MKIAGFSFVRNAIKLDYPIVQALQSILPLCDEIIVAVGNSEDDTRNLVSNIDPKIKVVDTVWDDTLKSGGTVLADETNKAFRAVDPSADWCIYIQGDEVLHEDGLDNVMHAMKKWKDHKEVDGLLFNYRHFYGSYDYIGMESQWYRHEIRVIRNDKSIFSYKDAQGFRKGNNEKLRVKPVNAFIHHYGWVHDIRTMISKWAVRDHFMHGKETDPNKIELPEDYLSQANIVLKKFEGTHPGVMRERVERMNWPFEYDEKKNKLKPKDLFKGAIEKVTGHRPFDYKNYKII
jgi:hypothetical protein